MGKLKDKKVVLIGGGTGTSVFLRTLKAYAADITAIVTVADDGGSSGLIRNEFGLLPPGDIRNCLIALAEDENIMAELMGVRFSEGLFKKQSLGNLMIAAMTQIRGSFPLAVKSLGEVLNIKGSVYPVSEKNIVLCANTTNGGFVKGESAIAHYCERNNCMIKKLSLLPPDASLMSECAEAIDKADIIVYVPGSLFTSLIPNLLVCGMCEALKSSSAVKYYLPNIMTEKGETTNFDLSDHLHAIEQHAKCEGIIEHVVYNIAQVPSDILMRYAYEGATQVKNYISPEYTNKYKFHGLDMLDLSNRYVRHDSRAFWEMLDK